MSLKLLFPVHALITFAAGIVLIVAPAAIPSTVDITLYPHQYLLSYFLGSAEIALAFLSFGARRITDWNSLRLIVFTLILFHCTTAFLEIYVLTQEKSSVLLTNVLLRIIISWLFFRCLRQQKFSTR